MSNETKFTPGPWVVAFGPIANVGIVAPQSSEFIATIVYKECNADLIAAAPDLYAALESFINADQPTPDWQNKTYDECLALAKSIKPNAIAALAKARGEV